MILVSNASTVTSKHYWLQVASMNIRSLCFLGDSTKKVQGDQDIIAVETYSFDEMLFAILVSMRN
jgi:hypothetical protein